MNNKEKQLVDAIANLCQELGWSIAVPFADDDEDKIDGLLIGTEDYINEILIQLDEFSEIDFENDDILDGIVLKKDDKETIH